MHERYWLYGAVIFGGSILILALAAAEAWLDVRRLRAQCLAQEAEGREPAGPTYTVRWRDEGPFECWMHGRIEWLDYDSLLIDDGYEMCVIVPRNRIIEMS